EQTKSAHNVDIRADLYSLGCTFYYLLAGAPPFGDVQGAHKFHKHRTEEPRPIEQWRADVPAAVGAVVRKLMAKRPEDRYQLPSQVGDSLASLIPSLPSTSQVEITPQRSPATRAAGAAPPEGWQPS